MAVILVEPPSSVVSLEDAKKHLQVDHTDDDSLIEGFIEAATAWVDTPAGWLGRALGIQTLELITSDFLGAAEGGAIPLPYVPVLETVSISYVDRDGVKQVLPEEDYEMDIGGVRPVYGKQWPNVRPQSDAIRIRYKAGYAKADPSSPDKWVNDIPRPIRIAILMLVAQWYAVREPVNIGNIVNDLPFAVEALLQPFRVYR